MIEIPFDPNIFNSGSFTLSWHGFMSFIAVGGAVYLVGRWAKKGGIDPDVVYNVAVFGIIGGILGARLVHVADNWDFYSSNPGNIFQVWAGGIGLWGGILGGWLGAMAYAVVNNRITKDPNMKVPIGRLMDLTAPAILIAQAIGRVGDLINGEHWSKATDLPWGWVFTNFNSPGFQGPPSSRTDISWDPTQATHPTAAYELIGDLLLFLVVWKLRGKLIPHGALWMVYLTLYSIMRFTIQFLRVDEVKVWGLQEAHFIALISVAVTVPWMVMFLRWKRGSSDDDKPDETASGGSPKTRRRRRATA
jgi:phosphatidylglycerol:prolipoprotein diacylglycerol transferase